MRRLVVLVAAASCLAAQTRRQERDLRYEKDEPGRVTPAAKVSVPRGYALVVGIGEYRNLPETGQLRYSERDAEAIYSILISPEGGNFRFENVHKLIGPKATLANLKHELETWLPGIAREDDRVFIYFAGHGFVRGGKAYLAPYDIDLSRIASSGYPMDTLGNVIGSRVKAKWKVLLTDACHSGAINPDADVQAINRSLMDLNKSLFSFTASRDRERSFESPDWGGGHGIFTYYVVKGLEGQAEESGDGIVTADELAEYVRRNVREATGGKQNPVSERGSFDPNMLLAYVPSSRKPGAPPPPKEGTLIITTNMDGVEVFIDGKSHGVVNKSAPLRVPGLVPGAHTIKAVKMGYEPDGPREEMVYPGQEAPVNVRILVARRRNKAALDAFDKGLDEYNKGFAQHYKRAAAHFEEALRADPKYSQASLYLGRAYNALFENEPARKYFKLAIDIDPDYVEARATYGGMLLDLGDVDEAIRQLNAVVQRDPKHALAWCLLAQALRRKELYKESIEAARKSIALNPANGEAHLWLAESLRMSKQYPDAIGEYGQYLRLSNFNSGLAGQLNYWVNGFLTGLGRKKRAAQQDIWRELRSHAFFGLCDSERKLSHFDRAIEYCQQALAYDRGDPYVHYALALAYARKAEQTGSIENLPAARKHFAAMLEINAEMSEAEYAKKNIASIDALLRGH
ncbi:MAG: tetratricopeptide repeat protein [Acidobacteria bacterium]|nr:tetratricopeptide repeat protein [Acidobacteriota bacterium]MBI3282039.1 tetratricopeptide repeat protein [Acidobacteriota bacterium]